MNGCYNCAKGRASTTRGATICVNCESGKSTPNYSPPLDKYQATLRMTGCCNGGNAALAATHAQWQGQSEADVLNDMYEHCERAKSGATAPSVDSVCGCSVAPTTCEKQTAFAPPDTSQYSSWEKANCLTTSQYSRL